MIWCFLSEKDDQVSEVLFEEKRRQLITPLIHQAVITLEVACINRAPGCVLLFCPDTPSLLKWQLVPG